MPYNQRHLYFDAARNLVTPFTPYMLCKYHLSNEVPYRDVLWLNPFSRDIRSHHKDIKHGDMVFCDSDMIKQFVHAVLPLIDCEIVLMTGKCHIPAITHDRYADELLMSPKISFWFSQNQCIDHPKCYAFPYGVLLESACVLVNKMTSRRLIKDNKIYYTYVSTEGHITGEAMEDRKALVEVMDHWVPLDKYYNKMNQHRFVASPRGDRPDTYRHWESIAMGCVPICNIPSQYKELFGKNMIYLDKMKDIFKLDPATLKHASPDIEIVTVSYWRKHIKDVTKGIYKKHNRIEP